MEYLEKIKKMLCRELEEYGEKNRISGSDLEVIWKLTDTVKNLNKIEMLDEGGYSERRGGGSSRGMSYDDDMSYARGGGGRGGRSNARRDSMGRYSSEDSYDYSENSYARSRNYSNDDDKKEYLMDKLGEIMRTADPNEREILKQTMRKIEKA